jgi:hypothetical protein
MSATLKGWLIGIANAAISGVASGGAANLIGVGWQKAVAIAGTSAVVSIAKWIIQHPIPGGQ